MRLLITTQVLDRDDAGYFGFFHAWVLEFAKHCEQVIVICLKEGTYDLPHNVRVYSLGKPYFAKASQGAGVRLLNRFKYAVRFLGLAWRLRREYDSVFVHMNPEYAVLMGPLWRLWGKRVVLWYLHRSVDIKLRIAVLFINNVVSASTESFRLATKKLVIVGHGIDPMFVPVAKVPSDILRVMYWGRLSPSKCVDKILAAVKVLVEKNTPVQFTIIGAVARPSDELYVGELKRMGMALPQGLVQFVGGVPHRQIPKYLAEADVCVNISTTESMDKTVLEAMAAGVPVVASNVSFKAILGPLGLYAEDISPEALAKLIQRAAGVDTTPLIEYVRQNHSLPALIPRILGVFKN